jgi:hypothetical protein
MIADARRHARRPAANPEARLGISHGQGSGPPFDGLRLGGLPTG